MMRIRMMRLLIVSLIVVTFLVIGVGVGVAQMGDVEIPLDQVHRGDPGERFLEAEIIAGDRIGWTCLVTLDRRNNSSIHAKDGHPNHGTNLIVESANGFEISTTNTIAFKNIESESFDVASLVFTIAGDIRVYTQIGEDGVSSMGFLLEFECNPPPEETTTTTMPPTTTTTTHPPHPTTTTMPPTTTTTVTVPESTTSTTHVDTPTTTVVPEPTTSTTETPEGGVPAGGGGCDEGACVVATVVWSWTLWMILFGGLLIVLSGITLWRVFRK